MAEKRGRSRIVMHETHGRDAKVHGESLVVNSLDKQSSNVQRIHRRIEEMGR
jgi:hypothetical protein